MFENFFKKGKGQTSLEILIVMGGLIIIAVVVVTIILASSKSKVTQITDADRQNTEIIDKTLFPPNINSLYCVYENNQVTYNLSIIPSVTKDLSEYCLIVNGVKTDNCVPANQTTLSFTSSDVGNGNYKVALVSKNINNGISSNSVGFSCKVDLPSGTGPGTTPPGGITPGIANFDCPTGYVAVPGEALLGTTSSSYPQGGFCVMKWEAKVDIDGDGIGDTNNSQLNCMPYYNLWATSDNKYSDLVDVWNIDGNSTRYLNNLYVTNQITLGGLKPVYYNADYNASCTQTICDCNLFNYTPNTDYKVVSSAEGQPLGRVDYASAKKFCEEIGPNYRLINNDEWMTIARNVESQPENWVGGIGTGSFKKGNTCAYNSLNNYYLDPIYVSGTLHRRAGYIDYLGSTHPGSKRTETSPARLVLANGKTDNEIWDLSGNMREWVDTSIIPLQGPSVSSGSPGNWFEFSMVTNNGTLASEKYKPINNIGSGQGVGQIYLNWITTNPLFFLRGGYGLSDSTCDTFSGIYSLSFLESNTNLYSKVCRCSGHESLALCNTCGTGTYNGSFQIGYKYSTPLYSVYGFRCVYIP